MTLFSMMDASPYISELASSVEWQTHMLPPIKEAAMEGTPELRAKLKLKQFYSSKRKNVLGGFLKRRGIVVRKNAFKKEMINMLQEHDLRNPKAAAEDGFLNESDGNPLGVEGNGDLGQMECD
jgi:hypothetical protein